MLVGLCGAASIGYIQRNSLAVAATTIQKDLDLTNDQMGWVLSAFFIPYALVQIPTGWLGDKLGSRIALALFSVLWSLLSGGMAMANTLTGLAVMRLGCGAAQAGLFPCSTRTIATWFPVTSRARSNGALGAFMSVGAFVGSVATGYLVTAMGWRTMFFWYSFPGIIWAVWFFAWFRDRPEDHSSVNPEELAWIRSAQPTNDEEPQATEPAKPDEEDNEGTPWLGLISSPAMFWICGQQFFRAAGYMFYASWFPAYLEKSHGVNTAEAGVLTSLPLLATVLGSLSGGAVSDAIYQRTQSRRWSRQAVGAAGMFACAALILLAFFIANATLAVLVIAAGSFCAAVAGPCAYTITMDMGGRHVATVFSTMNMCGNLGAVLFPLVVPSVVAASGWDSVLILFAGLYVAAGLCWLFFNPRGDVFSQSLIRRS